eukprot:COSAG04_NODE_4146_length_2271_cov_10.059392_2_plen_142_part_00
MRADGGADGGAPSGVSASSSIFFAVPNSTPSATMSTSLAAFSASALALARSPAGVRGNSSSFASSAFGSPPPESVRACLVGGPSGPSADMPSRNASARLWTMAIALAPLAILMANAGRELRELPRRTVVLSFVALSASCSA